MESLSELLATGEASAPAILAPGRAPLRYAELRDAVVRLGGQLCALGIGRGDRVALVLPNGPEMAVAFLAVASCATAAPLNPEYRRDELGFYLDDVGAVALVTLESDPTGARKAVPPRARCLSLVGEGAGLELRDGPSAPSRTSQQAATADDCALVLHTSGTTARPKIVPLLQRHLFASARNVAASLALTPADRCLEVMPLFHIHGLVAGLLAPLVSGGSTVCAPGFDALRFFAWLAEFQPTWYTAVPTMHQLVLRRAGRGGPERGELTLRFARSSSAALPVPVLEELERVLGVPVVEAYGMTEAAHQMATNPLPPAPRKPGSVGRASGVEICILDERGERLPPFARGEVAIRGASVIEAYENAPAANATSFRDGWFRTGDQGYLDQDDYLFLTGRLKELINRGGEKVSPLEVDEVLLRHPSVAQAVSFAMPHARLGEEVAAAVVLIPEADATERELIDFVSARLARFKVPRRVVLLDDLPKGPTGKVQRVGLAQRLGLV